MTRSGIEQIIALVEGKLEPEQIELVDIEYRKENGAQILRIFIDRAEGVSLETCSRATRIVKGVLDAEDIFYDSLEVSSPGWDRVLKKDRDLQRFNGERILLKTIKAYPGPRTIIGCLQGFDDKEIHVQNDEQFIGVPRDMISVIRLHPEI
ncbi:MAG TPA: ribosome maturation factor RimP [Syntrophomonadaceae bacterium]|nr:ribosome maturation factor RimP [Syntrophomonadaceae bacterium]